MLFDDINQVPPTADRAIIINVGTELVSSVAIASALRNAGMPLLVVNCTAPGPSRVLMNTLALQWNFDLIDMQLSPHGITLDRLFQNIFADRILLLDSDAEIKSPLVTARMQMAFNDPHVYGAGWIQSHDLLTPMQSGVDAKVVYCERPWIPCSMFRTSYVRAGLNAGSSFNETFVVGGAVRSLVPSQYMVDGMPAAVHYDTGAELHAWAVEAGFRFSGPAVGEVGEEVTHYHGVTRSAMMPRTLNATSLSEAESSSLQRLRDVYSEFWPGFTTAVESAEAFVGH